MNKSLSRNAAFWLLIVLSLASAMVGGWLIASQLGTMTTTLLDGTATGIEVYVGQSLVVVGAAVLGAGVVGLLLAVGLAAATSLVPRRAVDEPIALIDHEAPLAGETTGTPVDDAVTHSDSEPTDAPPTDATEPEPAVSR